MGINKTAELFVAIHKPLGNGGADPARALRWRIRATGSIENTTAAITPLTSARSAETISYVPCVLLNMAACGARGCMRSKLKDLRLRQGARCKGEMWTQGLHHRNGEELPRQRRTRRQTLFASARSSRKMHRNITTFRTCASTRLFLGTLTKRCSFCGVCTFTFSTSGARHQA